MTTLKRILAAVVFYPFGLIVLGVKWLLRVIRSAFGWLMSHKRTWLILLIVLLIISCGLCSWSLLVKIRTSTQSYYTPITTNSAATTPTDIIPTDIVPTPTPEQTFVPIANQNTFGRGHWTGQGQYEDPGRSPFTMDLYIQLQHGNGFSGYLQEGTNSVFISGTLQENSFSFHSTGTRSGDSNGITVGCVYSGSIYQGQINQGTWDCNPVNVPLKGNFNLGFVG